MAALFGLKITYPICSMFAICSFKNLGTGLLATTDLDTNKGKSSGDGGGDDGLSDLGLDPLLAALLRKIPSTEKGWPAAQRIRWFRTFAMNVSQIYDGDEGSLVEMKITLDDTME